MRDGNDKFQPRLMQQEIEEALEENGSSLRERFEKKEQMVLKVDVRPVKIAVELWNYLTVVILAAFAFIGMFSLIDPMLRQCLFSMLRQFWRSVFL